jgi:hypothetical protein
MSYSFVVKYDLCVLIKIIFMVKSCIRTHEEFVTAVYIYMSTNSNITDAK